MSRTKIEVDPLQLYGAVVMYMSKLYDRTHKEERTVLTQFICERTAQECVAHIKNLTSEKKENRLKIDSKEVE